MNALVKKGLDVRVIVRTNERGLSSAVMKGFDEARGDWLICMDADLQVCYCHVVSGVVYFVVDLFY